MYPLRTLIVCGEMETIDKLREALTPPDYELEIGLTPSVAFSILSDRQMDLIIFDIDVQEIVDIDFLKRMRAIASETPIVAMYGEAKKRTVSKVARQGIRKPLQKPIDPDELLKSIHRALPDFQAV